VPLLLRPLLDDSFADVREALEIVPPRALLVVDSLQLTPAPRPAARIEERVALAVRALKALAVERNVALLATAQLPRHRAGRADPPGRRWTTSVDSAPSSRTPMWYSRSIGRRCTGPDRVSKGQRS
jgi:hypothetical protein